MSEPIGFFLTWTCYGTWLHGDERGSVDLDHNIAGTPFLSANRPRASSANRQLRREPVRLDAKARCVVHEAIAECCRFRAWRLEALNVRTNHVHAIVVPKTLGRPEPILAQLKAWATRRLRERAGFSRDTPIWTHHGSTRYLWDERSMCAAIDYVLARQGAELD